MLFSQCFLPVLETFLPFVLNLKFSSANFSTVEEPKMCRLES